MTPGDYIALTAALGGLICFWMRIEHRLTRVEEAIRSVRRELKLPQ